MNDTEILSYDIFQYNEFFFLENIIVYRLNKLLRQIKLTDVLEK